VNFASAAGLGFFCPTPRLAGGFFVELRMRRVWTTKRNRSLSKAKNHHSDFGRHVISSIGAAALGIATTMPAFAGGSNTATTAATPATPAGVVTSTPQLSSVGAGGCAWQYTKAINNLGQQAITANDVGLAANAVGAAAAVTGRSATRLLPGRFP
jgi:hypothetical protein